MPGCFINSTFRQLPFSQPQNRFSNTKACQQNIQQYHATEMLALLALSTLAMRLKEAKPIRAGNIPSQFCRCYDHQTFQILFLLKVLCDFC
jgi:hypothetical protein